MARTLEWSAAIKSAAPAALVFGPASYGWNGFINLQNAPDAGQRDFLDFYLESLRAAEKRERRRLLDVLDLHWYPEAKGGGVRITEANTSPAVAAARVQAPRSLWDPTYVEQSWISQDAKVGAIRLIPRMKEKIAAFYPGTRLAITEYDYGAGDHISGAIAQADVLGIFGREDVFAAARWALTSKNDFADAAFDAYTNYDGASGRFGDISIRATTTNTADTSVYASVASANSDRIVVVAINKTSIAQTAEIFIRHPVALSLDQTYQLTAAVSSLSAGAALKPATPNVFLLPMPASSVTTVVLTR
jgi:hypothetical protein